MRIYISVQLLDKDETVSAILLLEFESWLLKMPDMLSTSGTPLITLLDDAIFKVETISVWRACLKHHRIRVLHHFIYEFDAIKLFKVLRTQMT